MTRWALLGLVVLLLSGSFAAEPTGAVTLRWAAPAPIARQTLIGFAVYKLHNGQTVYIGMVGPDATSVTVGNLPLGEPHTFLMKTLDPVLGESGWSEPATSYAAPVSGVQPGPPSHLVVKTP